MNSVVDNWSSVGQNRRDNFSRNVEHAVVLKCWYNYFEMLNVTDGLNLSVLLRFTGILPGVFAGSHTRALSPSQISFFLFLVISSDCNLYEIMINKLLVFKWVHYTRSLGHVLYHISSKKNMDPVLLNYTEISPTSLRCLMARSCLPSSQTYSQTSFAIFQSCKTESFHLIFYPISCIYCWFVSVCLAFSIFNQTSLVCHFFLQCWHFQRYKSIIVHYVGIVVSLYITYSQF